jgi:DNA recombination protein RmuC
MAEDILRLAGLNEKVNYVKQSPEEAEAGKPDFTFYLPNDLKVNMDVKFPLEAYKAYLDAETDEARTEQLTALAAAVRKHVRDVAGRGYIDTKGGTVDYVIVFIASEQIMALALSAKPDLIDEALGRRVVLASPFTLYAMLAVIRQAAENANIMRTADEVLSLLGAFNKQWQAYCEQMDKLGQRIEQAGREYEALRTTRTNMLQRPLDKIEDLRAARQLAEDAEQG